MLDALFIDSEVEELFADDTLIRAMLRFEAELVFAQADLSLVPVEYARQIAHVCEAARIDPAKIIDAAKQTGNPIIPLVKALKALVRETNADAARFVHAGATSQDVIDTAVVMQLKAAIPILEQRVGSLERNFLKLIGAHRETVMIGRTLLQQARPISFAFKVAGWLDQLLRCKQRLREVQERALVLQFGGAVGTLAANGEAALAIMAKLAARLQLGEPPIPWHTARDRFFEVASTLAMLGGCLGKIALDASLLMQTEIGEVSEAVEEGRGGSSAMPHKRNPIAPTMIIAASTRLPGLLATMAASMAHEHERAVGHWHAEWEPLPEMVCLTAGAIKHADDLFARIEVNAARMRENIDATQGLVFAESVTVALGAKIDKSEAERIIKAACQRAQEKRCHLHQILLADPAVSTALDATVLEELFRPENSLGSANALIDRVLRQRQEQLKFEGQK